jgi:hypothetical protein
MWTKSDSRNTIRRLELQDCTNLIHIGLDPDQPALKVDVSTHTLSRTRHYRIGCKAMVPIRCYGCISVCFDPCSRNSTRCSVHAPGQNNINHLRMFKCGTENANAVSSLAQHEVDNSKINAVGQLARSGLPQASGFQRYLANIGGTGSSRGTQGGNSAQIVDMCGRPPNAM